MLSLIAGFVFAVDDVTERFLKVLRESILRGPCIYQGLSWPAFAAHMSTVSAPVNNQQKLVLNVVFRRFMLHHPSAVKDVELMRYQLGFFDLPIAEMLKQFSVIVENYASDANLEDPKTFYWQFMQSMQSFSPGRSLPDLSRVSLPEERTPALSNISSIPFCGSEESPQTARASDQIDSEDYPVGEDDEEESKYISNTRRWIDSVRRANEKPKTIPELRAVHLRPWRH